MGANDIVNLENVLKDYLGNDKTITDVVLSRLTTPGENFGSIMLKVDAQILDKKTNKKMNEFHAVAKLIPTEEILQKVFNVFVTFKNEIAFYSTIVPTLQNFQKQHGVEDVIDCFPKMYGARTNLNSSNDAVDANAVLMLENLIMSGYKNVDRQVGFDLDTTKMLLSDLARFHAVPIALKLEKPTVFEEKIKPYLAFMNPPGPPPGLAEQLVKIFEESGHDKTVIDKLIKLQSTKPPQNSREPFATLTHNDFWVNNTMVKFDKDNKPVDNKMVDFQLCSYESPAKDLTFFLFSSVQTQVLKQSLDELIQFYHNQFVDNLEKLDCEQISRFSFESFMKEVETEAKESQLMHVLGMFFVIFAEKGTFRAEGPPVFPQASQAQKEKSWYVINEFVNRGWL